MNTGPTIDIMNQMAETLENAAKSIRQQAKELSQSGDFSIAGDALNTVKNTFSNMRIDLLVTRPIREYQREAAVADGKKVGQD